MLKVRARGTAMVPDMHGAVRRFIGRSPVVGNDGVS